jgi:large subunit ribosomal protein L9
MQIILLDKVVNLGSLGDVVRVKDGYARNYLIPQRLARRATPEAVAEFEAKRALLEAAAAEKLVAAKTLAEKLTGITLKFAQKAGVDGRLFGSVTNVDIVQSLAELGFSVEKSQVRMTQGHIKTVGIYPVSLQLHTDVLVDLSLEISAVENA